MTKAQSLTAICSLTIRYAALFGGIIAVMLFVANAERPGNMPGLEHHVSAHLSTAELSHRLN